MTVWPVAEVVETERLTLEPLRPDHAAELAAALADVALHEFIGGRPATADELRSRYERQSAGRSPDGSEGWLNWVVRVRGTGAAAGTVQATVTAGEAELAWVIGTGHQRRGYAAEAAAGMAAWLRARGVRTLTAHIHPGHRASARVAGRLGMRPTGTVEDGEVRWTTELTPRLVRRIRRDFPPGSADPVIAELEVMPATLPFPGQDPERLQASVVLLARGDHAAFVDRLTLTRSDWRDTLVFAGLGDEDWPTRLTALLGPPT